MLCLKYWPEGFAFKNRQNVDRFVNNSFSKQPTIIVLKVKCISYDILRLMTNLGKDR